jgi:hypothetical protein
LKEINSGVIHLSSWAEKGIMRGRVCDYAIIANNYDSDGLNSVCATAESR